MIWIDNRWLAFNQAFSSLVSMPSLTIRVWIGTHVSRSNPNQVVPFNSPRVWAGAKKEEEMISFKQTHGTKDLPKSSPSLYVQKAQILSAYPIYHPNLLKRIILKKNNRWKQKRNSQKPGSLVITCPGTSGMLLEKLWGPSCTLKKAPKPWPVPCCPNVQFEWNKV